MKKKKISNLLKDIFCFEFICSLIFMIVTYVMVMKHELWFDEVQAWSLAKNLNVLELINQMKFEGHSAMWSLFLKIFIECGFSFVILNFISWFIGVLSALTICYKTNFNKFTKVLILFNVSLLYFSTVFARPYCIAYFMMTLLMVFYKERYNKPYLVGLILLILSNTHLLVMGFMLALFLIEFYGLFKYKDNKKEKIILMSFMVFGVLLFFFQIVGSLGARDSMFVNIPISEILINFMLAITDFFKAIFNWPIMSFLGGIFLLLLFIRIYNYKKYFFILLCTFSFYFIISLFYPLNSYKTFFIVVSIIFCVKELVEEHNDRTIVKYFLLFLLCSCPQSIFSVNDEYKNKISDSEIVWQYIENKEKSNFLTFTKNTIFILYCEECNYINYYDGKSYKYSNFEDYGLTIFNYDRVNKLIIDNDINYLIVDMYTEEFLKEDFEYLEFTKNLITKIYDADRENCTSKTTTHCEKFSLYKINKGELNYAK